MSLVLLATGLWGTAYLVGAIPFGYMIGRLRGVDLFREGSGNIGATNAARVLGWGWGLGVFVLDFAKGALPVIAAVPLAQLAVPMDELSEFAFHLLRAGTALAAFLGHLFPVYLKFRGGKGVATGAGTVSVLAPLPTACALIAWGLVFLTSRIVSLASVTAVGVLFAVYLLWQPRPGSIDTLPLTAFIGLGTGLVVIKHRANLRRWWSGTEPPLLADSTMRQSLIRCVHLLALSLLFGGTAFFSLAAAPAIFAAFEAVVNEGPSDRTAHQRLIAPDAEPQAKKDLASALAGAAVGPIFPRLYMMQAVCVVIGLTTAWAWRKDAVYPRAARYRLLLLVLTAGLVATGWLLSSYLAELRPQRFHPDPALAAKAREQFTAWHLVSLALNLATIAVAGLLVILAAWLPSGTASAREQNPNGVGSDSLLAKPRSSTLQTTA